MVIVCFIGLTIQPDDARRHLDALYFGPASGGDIPAVIAEFEPDAIGIVDGVFHSRPAVLHKDILHALSRGITVFGAASMGALRAAEMNEYGVIGVGEIYQRFQAGEWTGDDEVAIPCYYAPSEGWRPVPGAEAMVNIRATIKEAIQRGVIDAEVGQSVLARAKAMCFFDRRWESVLEPAAFETHATAVVRLRGALPELRVDLKLRDATEMLDVMANWSPPDRSGRRPAASPCGPFWDATLFSRPLGVTPIGGMHGIDPEDAALVQDVLDYAIVSSAASANLVQDAMIRVLLLEIATVLGATAGQQETHLAAQCISDNLRNVRSAAPFDQEEILQLGAEEAVCELLHARYSNELSRGLLLTLLSEGLFAEIGVVIREKFARTGRQARRLLSAEEAREIVESHLARVGIADVTDHFDRYLAWLPTHRLRSAAALLATAKHEK